MPRIKYCVPVPPPNLAQDLIRRTMKARKVTSEEMGKRVHMEPASVRRKLMKGIWSIEDYRAWCLALGIDDPETVGKAVLNRW